MDDIESSQPFHDSIGVEDTTLNIPPSLGCSDSGVQNAKKRCAGLVPPNALTLTFPLPHSTTYSTHLRRLASTNQTDTMNCPSRVDEVFDHEGWNQNPSSLSGDTTTRADLNGIVNARNRRDNKNIEPDDRGEFVANSKHDAELRALADAGKKRPDDGYDNQALDISDVPHDYPNHLAAAAQRMWQVVLKFGGFIGPGQFSLHA